MQQFLLKTPSYYREWWFMSWYVLVRCWETFSLQLACDSTEFCLCFVTYKHVPHRLGKRTKFGLLKDGYNSAYRYFLNNFYDGFRQVGGLIWLCSCLPDRKIRCFYGRTRNSSGQSKARTNAHQCGLPVQRASAINRKKFFAGFN